jgi:hypothetical protein
VIGKVRGDLVRPGEERTEVQLERILLDDIKPVRLTDQPRKQRSERSIDLYSHHLTSLIDQGPRQDAEPWPNLEYIYTQSRAAGVYYAIKHITIYKKVLPKPLLRMQSMLGKKLFNLWS